MAGERHTTVAAILASNRQTQIQVAMLALSFLGFLLTFAQVGAAWLLAALGVVIGMLRGVFTGRWLGLVNPIHELAAGAWIGTLFVMLTAGLSAVLGPATPPERRGPAAVRMVYAFSPFALGSASVLVVFGVITAVRHVKYWSALWTTPYGWTLIVKLVLVSGVVALGAWNWRRQRPRLGSEEGARSLTRSARAELTVAALVLLVTAVLVSLPTPKKPGEEKDESRAPAPPATVAAAPR
jgi:putative copper export protein